jgi:hypothetical protein
LNHNRSQIIILGYPRRVLAEITIFLSRNPTTCDLQKLNFVGLGMFIGKKKNKSGKVSVRIFQKVNRANQLLKTIGCSSDPDKIKRLFSEGHKRIESHSGATLFDFDGKKGQVPGKNIQELIKAKHEFII